MRKRKVSDSGNANRPPDAHSPASGNAPALPVGLDGASFPLPPLQPDLYLNRELSWLAFNRRVLEEAADPSLPLLERAKFVAIFSSNLDEFFMIRVAGVKRKVVAGISEAGPDGRTPIEQFAAIRAETQRLLEEQTHLLTHEILPALASSGIQIEPVSNLTRDERAALRAVFERDVFPVLTPQAIDRARRFPHVSNQSLNLIVVLRSPSAGPRFARVKIPAILPRLVRVPAASEDVASHGPWRFVWLESLIAAHLEQLFPGNDVVASYPFYVVRDSDIEIDDDDDDHD
ncbi:MAG: hypothetical protein C4345_01780, partial [Chloroflexota bacterium]